MRVLDPGVDPVRGVDVGVLAAASPSWRRAGSSPTGSSASRPRPRTGSAARRDAAARGGRRPASSPASPSSWSPAGPSRSSPVSSATCASSIQQAPVRAPLVPAGIIGAALADLAAAVDRDLPGRLGDQPIAAFSRLAQLPADGVGELVAAAGGELIQLGDQGVAGAGAVAGDHQLPPQRRRQRGDRLVQQAQVIGGGVAARPSRGRSIQASGSPPVLSQTAISG